MVGWRFQHRHRFKVPFGNQDLLVGPIGSMGPEPALTHPYRSGVEQWSGGVFNTVTASGPVQRTGPTGRWDPEPALTHPHWSGVEQWSGGVFNTVTASRSRRAARTYRRLSPVPQAAASGNNLQSRSPPHFPANSSFWMRRFPKKLAVRGDSLPPLQVKADPPRERARKNGGFSGRKKPPLVDRYVNMCILTSGGHSSTESLLANIEFSPPSW